MASDARHLDNDNARRTPTHVLKLAREVLGQIDLDPASDAEAQKAVQAKNWYGPGVHGAFVAGLSLDWGGRVWLNPPGGVLDPKTLAPKASGPGLSSAAVWWWKLVHEYESGRVEAALFLGFTLEILRSAQSCPCKPPQAFPMCVPKARLRFPSSNGGNVNAPAAGSVIVYLGPYPQKFAACFGALGYISGV